MEKQPPFFTPGSAGPVLRVLLDRSPETSHVRNGILQAWAVILLTTGVIALAAWGVIYAVAQFGETPGY